MDQAFPDALNSFGRIVAEGGLIVDSAVDRSRWMAYEPVKCLQEISGLCHCMYKSPCGRSHVNLSSYRRSGEVGDISLLLIRRQFCQVEKRIGYRPILFDSFVEFVVQPEANLGSNVAFFSRRSIPRDRVDIFHGNIHSRLEEHEEPPTCFIIE